MPPKNYEDDYDDDSEDDNSGSEQDVQEILDEIKKDVPEVSKLSRKRKAKTSKGIYTRKETKIGDNRREKGPEERVLQFPNDDLSVVNGRLACRSCRIYNLALKHSSIRAHVRTSTHKANLLKRDRSQLTILSYGRIVQSNEQNGSAAGATLPVDVNTYRMSVAHGVLKSGIPFTILDSGSEMRDLLEDGHATCPKQACSDFIPLLLDKERTETISELDEAGTFSISSNGTINVAEALGVVRIVNANLNQIIILNCNRSQK